MLTLSFARKGNPAARTAGMHAAMTELTKAHAERGGE